jgi:hypothetical protein
LGIRRVSLAGAERLPLSRLATRPAEAVAVTFDRLAPPPSSGLRTSGSYIFCSVFVDPPNTSVYEPRAGTAKRTYRSPSRQPPLNAFSDESNCSRVRFARSRR